MNPIRFVEIVLQALLDVVLPVSAAAISGRMSVCIPHSRTVIAHGQPQSSIVNAPFYGDQPLPIGLFQNTVDDCVLDERLKRDFRKQTYLGACINLDFKPDFPLEPLLLNGYIHFAQQELVFERNKILSFVQDQLVIVGQA